jgi:general nucleoside transport system ATP-binding protein
VIENVNFRLHAGEVIGLAGMEGSGQDVLLRACAGLLRPVSGRVIVNGKDLTGRNFHDFMRSGVAFMPASRLEEGFGARFILGRALYPGDRSKEEIIHR